MVMDHILRMTRVRIHGSKVRKEGGGIKDQNNRLSKRHVCQTEEDLEFQGHFEENKTGCIGP